LTLSLPAREVPEGLTAGTYLQLAQEYIKLGWTEQARDALQLAIDSAAQNEEGKKTADSAVKLLRSKLPRFPVPLYAEQRNIEGWNLLSAGKTAEAKQIFEELIDEYPDFEWPYGNLSVLLLQSSETGKAIDLLKTALSVNKFYVQGWLHMATARGLELNFDAARKCVDEALTIDPDEVAALAMQDALERMRDL
jgi:tetratricopeptide (TPR) repeat protein